MRQVKKLCDCPVKTACLDKEKGHKTEEGAKFKNLGQKQFQEDY
jgi:hypothetical protein